MRIRLFQLGQRMGQGFGDEGTTVRAEMASGVRQVVMGGLDAVPCRQGLALGVVFERVQFFHGHSLYSFSAASAWRTAPMKARDLGGVLDALCQFDATADVDGIRAHAQHCVSRVLCAQATT